LEKTTMDKDEPQVEQSGCGCDSSSGDDTCCSPGGGKKNWRTVLFLTVLVLAGAVAAHSVLTNGGKTTPCGVGAICGIEQANGDACSKTAACPLEKANGDGVKPACCPMEQANGDGAKPACCPMEQANGDAEKAGCPSEIKACPKTGAAGKAAGCCPSEAAADPAPQPAPTVPTGCCPGH
jgi:hypothetical protein